MLSSFRKNNTDDIHLYAVVPARDFEAFSAFRGSGVTLIAEEEFAPHLTDDPVNGIRPGYINQEIVKLAFHELSLAESYFTVDSEAEFLRPFSHEDFLHPDGFPYSLLVEDHDLAVDPDYHRDYWQSRSEALRLIWQEVGVDDPVIRTCHGHQVLNAKVLSSFSEDFLKARDWTYVDALAVSPYEYTWYNAWLLKSQVIPVHPREPFVKVFHTEKDYLQAILAGVRAEDLARGYMAVVINSSFARHMNSPSTTANKPEVVARALSYGELAGVLRRKAAHSFRRFRSGN
jgi:hypothetical protein